MCKRSPYLEKDEDADCEEGDDDAGDKADYVPPLHGVKLSVEYGRGDRHEEGKGHIIDRRDDRRSERTEGAVQVHHLDGGAHDRVGEEDVGEPVGELVVALSPERVPRGHSEALGRHDVEAAGQRAYQHVDEHVRVAPARRGVEDEEADGGNGEKQVHDEGRLRQQVADERDVHRGIDLKATCVIAMNQMKSRQGRLRLFTYSRRVDDRHQIPDEGQERGNLPDEIEPLLQDVTSHDRRRHDSEGAQRGHQCRRDHDVREKVGKLP